MECSTAAKAVDGLAANASCKASVRCAVSSDTRRSGSGLMICSSSSSVSSVVAPAMVTTLDRADEAGRSEEHTSELQSLMRISYAVFCLKKKTTKSSHDDMPDSRNQLTQYITVQQRHHDNSTN